MACLSQDGNARTSSRSNAGIDNWSKNLLQGIAMNFGDCRQYKNKMNKNKEVPKNEKDHLRDFRKAAATYSPTWWGSTIGVYGLNFSVRYGKRCLPVAIATAVYYLREKIWLGRKMRFRKRYRAISTGRLRASPPLHLLPINVVVSHDPQWKSHLEDGFALRCFQRLS